MFYSSLVLGFLNLIPIPPLDGSWILSGLLPRKLSEFLENARGFGNVFFLLLVVTPALDYFLAIPLGVAMGCLQALISAMRFG
jgi:Zn-dependent protease